jgi:fatty-acyl-CoA synthase
MSLQTLLDDSPAARFGTIGRALPGSEVRIADPRSGATLPVGGVGEICVRGYQVMSGYFERPDATRDAIDADGWMHSGDLGSLDGDGLFHIEGRVKDMIIRGGENIYPYEIEEVLAAHPAVAQAVVIGVPDDTYGEIVGAFVRLRGEADAPALFAHCRAQLAAFKAPRLWWFVDAYPLTPSGKVQKFALRERAVAGEPPIRV